jgi:type 1 fimbriae regulatory protein FimB/type 1 fimbriae regulatory protein FimE
MEKSSMLPKLKLVQPNPENRTVATPLRQKDTRSRKHLLAEEVDKLIEAARQNTYGLRDGLMAMMAYRHGLRSAELVGLQWSQVDLRAGTLHVNRVKNGTPATHPLQGDTLRALRKLHKDAKSPYIFVSERGAPFSTAGFQKMIERAGIKAGLAIKPHAHMLRHATGFKLANDGVDTRSIQAYLGHVSIEHTTRYTELAPGRFRDFWR